MKEMLQFSKIADSNEKVDSLWVPESWGREAFSTLGALSQITRNVKLGTSIINIYARTPATVAMAATTLDILSNNRTLLGLGVSTEEIVEHWHGLKFEKPLERIQEYIECLRQIIKGEKVNYRGVYFNIKNFKILHTPPRRKIPTFMAAINKKMITLSTIIADGVILYLRPIEELRETVSYIKYLSTNKGEFEIAVVFIGAISNSLPEKARQRAAKTLAFYISVGKFYNRFLSNNGFRIEVEQISREYIQHGLDAAANAVPEKMLNSLTIYGNTDQCIKSLEKILASGISLPIIQINPIGDSKSSIREFLSIL